MSKYFNKVRTGHKFVGLWILGNVGITIIQEPFSDNWCLAKKGGSVKRVTGDLSAAKRIQDSETERA